MMMDPAIKIALAGALAALLGTFIGHFANWWRGRP